MARPSTAGDGSQRAAGRSPRRSAPEAAGRPLTTRPWGLSRAQWVWVAVVFAAVVLCFASYEVLNAAPPGSRWPAYFAFDPRAGGLVQPQHGAAAYQTFVLKSWADEGLPFVPWLAVPYLSYLFFVPFVIPVLNLAAGTFRRFLTVGAAFVVSQVVLDAGFILFQTNVIRDVSAGEGLPGSLVRLVWGNDKPFNGFPSAHVAWTTIGILSLWRLRRRFPWIAWPLMAWLCLVYPATVLLRQHYLIDVYAGLFIGFAVYWACMFVVERPRLVPSDETPLTLS
jgi:membrane-associated phospholipid phosphatase